MKPIRSRFPSRHALVAMLATGLPFASAQDNDRSVSGARGPASSRPVPSPSPIPARLSVNLAPVESSSQTKGEMVFVMTGGAVSVSGRIEGLETDKRYQVLVRTPIAPLPTAPEQKEFPSPESGAEADPPKGPAEIASSVAFTEAELGMVVADGRGVSNLNTIIQNKDLSPPPNGILGCTVIIKRAAPLDEP